LRAKGSRQATSGCLQRRRISEAVHTARTQDGTKHSAHVDGWSLTTTTTKISLPRICIHWFRSFTNGTSPRCQRKSPEAKKVRLSLSNTNKEDDRCLQTLLAIDLS
jgi:hypothetical protein